MATASIKMTGGNKLEAHLKTIAASIKKGSVSVGFLEGSTYPDGTPVAQVAFWNEFGTTNAPPRSFFRNTIKEKSPQWGKELGAIVKKTDSSTALKLMGTRIKDQLTKAIADWPADNAESTEQAKGFNKGLVDTGQMQNSVDFEVTE